MIVCSPMKLTGEEIGPMQHSFLFASGAAISIAFERVRWQTCSMVRTLEFPIPQVQSKIRTISKRGLVGTISEIDAPLRFREDRGQTFPFSILRPKNTHSSGSLRLIDLVSSVMTQGF